MAKVPRRVIPTVIHTGPGFSTMAGSVTSIAALRTKYMTTGKSAPYRSKRNMTGETDDRGRLLGPELADWIIRDSQVKLSGYPVVGTDDEVCSSDKEEKLVYAPDNFQYTLNLERIEDREEKLKNIINKYEETFKILGMYALRWHYLMEDVEENAGVADIFENMQLLRRLSGCKVF